MNEFNMNYQEAIEHVLSGGFVVGEKFNDNEFLYKNSNGVVCVGDDRFPLIDTQDDHLVTITSIVSQKYKKLTRTPDREIGHYFVRSLDRQCSFGADSPWFVAYWNGLQWFLPTWDDDEGEYDRFWDEIDENQIAK